MAKVQLTPLFVKTTNAEVGKRKTDFFDLQCKGLLLESRATGGKTYYLRYRNSRGVAHQLKPRLSISPKTAIVSPSGKPRTRRDF